MSVAITLEVFIQRSKAVHSGSNYSYPIQTLSGVYQKIEVVCPVHGSFQQVAATHLAGHGCPKCAIAVLSKHALGRAAKHLDEVKCVFPDYDYSEFIRTFVTVTKPVTIICPTHGEFSKPPHKMKMGHGCQKCGKEVSRISRLVTKEDFLQRAKEVHGDTYLYHNLGWKGFREFATITCQIHGDFQQKPESHATLKHGCGKCSSLRGSNASRVSSTEFYSRLFDTYAGKYKYFNDFTTVCDDIRIECTTHGEFSQIAYVHLRGGGCPKCSNAIRGVASRLTFNQFVEKSRELHGDTYLYLQNTYTDYQDKVSIVCNTHGVFNQKASEHARGSRCPVCAKTISIGQLELTSYVESLGFAVIRDYKYGESKREVDIYIPELKVALEFDGIYFHSTKFKPPNSHREKQEEVNSCGVELIQIFSDEWETKAQQVKNLIAARLNKLSERVYARACTLVPVSDSEARKFYDNNHVQGWRRSGYNRGLTYKGELVAVMTFSGNTSHRGKESIEGEYELARFASKLRVVGGASKLFKDLVVSLNAETVVSYCDTRKFTGKTYKALNFTCQHTTRPSYSYMRSGVFTRIHKSHFKKELLADRLGAGYNPSLTERENCENAGYYQVYDCGLTKWIWTKNGNP